MTTEEIIWFIVRSLCIFMAIKMTEDVIKKIIALKRAKIAQFFVKTAFAFERNGCLVGTLTYYTEAAIQKELSVTKLDLADYVRSFLPNMNLPIEPVDVSDLRKASIPTRAVIKKEIVEKYATLIIHNEKALVIVNKLGQDPRASWWFGTVLVSDNSEVIDVATSRFRKAKKNDPTCHVVRS